MSTTPTKDEAERLTRLRAQAARAQAARKQHAAARASHDPERLARSVRIVQAAIADGRLSVRDLTTRGRAL